MNKTSQFETHLCPVSKTLFTGVSIFDYIYINNNKYIWKTIGWAKVFNNNHSSHIINIKQYIVYMWYNSSFVLAENISTYRGYFK